MDSDSIIIIIVLFILIMLSAFFSSSETAISSYNHLRMRTLAENGNKRAKQVLALSEDYNRTLSTILVGNNIVNIATASLATILFISWLGNAGATVSTIVTTVLVLIFGEITPKSLAKESPEKAILAVVPILQVLCILLTPVTFLFEQWKKLISKFYKPNLDSSTITGEELRTLVNEAEQQGVIAEDDKQLLESAFDFSESIVEEILTPRVDVVAVSETATMSEIAEKFVHSEHSRILIFQESIDHIIGVIHLRDLFEAGLRGEKNIKEIISPVLYIPAFTKIQSALKTLQSNNSHMAVISDEYGGTVGIITMEDILEELVGEIWDEHDEVENNIHQLEENKYIVAGHTDAEDVLEIFYKENNSEKTTISGWVIEKLDKIPDSGDVLEFENLKVTVVTMEGKRIAECIFEQIVQEEMSEMD